MNAERRKAIAKAADAMDILISELDQIRDEEEQAYENLPESLQSSEKGDKMQEGIDALDAAKDNLESSKWELDGIR